MLRRLPVAVLKVRGRTVPNSTWPQSLLTAASSQVRRAATQIDSARNSKIKFLELQTRWQATWDKNEPASAREALIQHKDHSRRSPDYMRQLKSPQSVLEVLQWHFGQSAIRNKRLTVVDRILNLPQPNCTSWDAAIRDYGSDIALTSLLFTEQMVDIPVIDEAALEHTRNWFESILEAVVAAHSSYADTQNAPEIPGVPESLYEPNLERWSDHVSKEHLEYVQVPPEEPEAPNPEDGEEYRLWLTTQRAISAYTEPITVRNSLQTIKSRLIRLTNAVKRYGDAQVVICSMHYYSARVLLSLVAPFAPALAEECWVILHYGCNWSEEADTESNYEADEESVQELIGLIEDDLDRKDLPRQYRPKTLQSIMDQPFPVNRLRDHRRK